MRLRLLRLRRSTATAALALGLLSGCAGSSTFDKCVDHSVGEGVDRAVAEQGCEAAVGDDR